MLSQKKCTKIVEKMTPKNREINTIDPKKISRNKKLKK